MKITIVAIGSTGDVRPCVILSKELIKRNHNVKIIAFDRFEKMITDIGAEFAKCPGNIVEFMGAITDPNSTPFDMLAKMRKFFAKNKNGMEQVLINCMSDSDMMVYATVGASMAVYAAEKCKIPYARLNFYPDMERSDIPQFLYPNLPLPKPIKKWYNILGHRIAFELAVDVYRKAFKDWPKKFNLPSKTKYFYFRSDGKPVDQIMAYSEYVIPSPKEYQVEHVHVCGYLFEKESNIYYTPEDGLMEFLNAGPAPIYIGFGSMSEGSFNDLWQMVIEALKKTGKRAIISKGWGGLSENDLPENIYTIGFCPHEWLFSHVSGIVHHGGAGTTAAALRFGNPTLVIPFGSEQTFWGKQILKHGCGPKYIPRKKLTVKKLVKALEEMDSPIFRENAIKIAKIINSENGIENACVCIEKIAEKGFGK